MKLFVPGRICLFGEHSDWAGGYRRVNPAIEPGCAIIAGTDQGIHAEVEPHPSALVLTATTLDGVHRGPRQIPMEAEALLAEATAGGFWSYVAGVAYQALRRHKVKGLTLDNDRTDLPVKKGLSSSAAISVLTARAFNQAYGLGLTTRQEMELAYQGEITTPSQCGRMDQGCAFGRRAVLMTFDGDRLETTELEVPGQLHFVLIDLRARKDTVKILRCLHQSFPLAASALDHGVQELLGWRNRRIVQAAVAELGRADGPRLGELMTEAQDAFDRYAIPACPEELTAPMLHRVLGFRPLANHIWGGKGVGSQGDGSAQLLARSAADQQAVIEIIERDLRLPCLKLTLSSVAASGDPAPGSG